MLDKLLCHKCHEEKLQIHGGDFAKEDAEIHLFNFLNSWKREKCSCVLGESISIYAFPPSNCVYALEHVFMEEDWQAELANQLKQKYSDLVM